MQWMRMEGFEEGRVLWRRMEGVGKGAMEEGQCNFVKPLWMFVAQKVWNIQLAVEQRKEEVCMPVW